MSREWHSVLNRLLSTSCQNSDIDSALEKNISEFLNTKSLSFDSICENSNFTKIDFRTEFESVQWRYLVVIAYILMEISDELSNESVDMISVNLQKNVKASFEFIVGMGLLPTLIPGVGVPIEKRTEHGLLVKSEDLSIMDKYGRLKSVCNLFTELCKTADIKTIVYSHFLRDYLAGLIQLSHAPILKPGRKSPAAPDFVMTEDLWNDLSKDQEKYKLILDDVVAKTFRPLLIKELLILQSGVSPAPPAFLKRFLSNTLSGILISNDGLLSVMRYFFDCAEIDTGDQWKHVEMIKRLISVKHGSLDLNGYLSNICTQMKRIIRSKPNHNYVTVVAACISNLYAEYPDNRAVIDVIESILEPFTDETDVNGTLVLSFDEVDESVKVLDLCFNVPKMCLPSHLLSSIIVQIFSLRVFAAKNELDNLLINYFGSKDFDADSWFTAVVFKTGTERIAVNKNRYYELKDDRVQIKCSDDNVTIEDSVSCILQLIDDHDIANVARSFFVFCLKTVMKFSVDVDVSKDLLVHEDSPCDLISKESEYLLIFMKALERLTSMKTIVKSFNEDPKLIVDFIRSIFHGYIEDVEKKSTPKNEECVLICLTLFTVLLTRSSNRKQFEAALKPILTDMDRIRQNTSRDEIKMLCDEVNGLILGEKQSSGVSEFESALMEICDPLLPVRAHGLMQLIKLIEKKDAETVSKKHYVQCIFEENLKSDDSYVYLTAINGLASLATFFTDDVIELLTKEFLESKEKDFTSTSEENNENSLIRMKIGEILVKLTKNLGEMAAAHSPLLLNTFLCGCKDSDDLVRASSLSNLAEVCRVLSYKIHPVLYEMLTCLQCVLETDSSPECRRAAVLVVSSLLKGLGKDALVFLQESLLPLYRTLKKLYSDASEDSTVRLHAQIALEELNIIVKDLIFAPIKYEKKISILDT